MISSRTPFVVFPVRSLSAAGMFKPRSATSWGDPDPSYILKLSGITFKCSYDPPTQNLLVECGTATYAITVDFIAGRIFFLCDCCGQPRNALVLDQDKFVCRVEYRENGSGYSKSLRSARFTMAFEQLQSHGAVARLVSPAAETPALPDPAPEEGTVDPRRAAETPLSTTKAIDLGRGAGQYRLYDFYQEKDREVWQNLETAPKYERPAFSCLTNRYPKLDMNVFGPRLMKQEGSFVARTLCWGERVERHKEVLFFIDWRGELPIVIAAHDFDDEEKISWQRLPLHRQDSGRFRWVCPVSGKNCDTLYLRHGLFASREAQWLYSPSQRAAGRQQGRNGARTKE